VVALFVVEILNTSVETAIDRISEERHPLSKLAKDLGSAAVFVAALFAGAVWITLAGPIGLRMIQA
jgi:diacylglycerol kinase (ATP)